MMKHWTSLIFVVVMAGGAAACNIPVFRYALERWRPDPCQLVVFHEGPLDAAAAKEVAKLRQLPSLAAEKSNTEIVYYDLLQTNKTSDSGSFEPAKLWEDLNGHESRSLPYVAMRATHSRGTVIGWHGLLKDAPPIVLDSPIRQQLTARLLNGDSIVWLLLKSSIEQRNDAVRVLLQAECNELSKSLKLPEGIGLPGSELHSDVPLFLKFTVLEFSREDAQEQFLVRLFSGFQPEAIADDQPLLIPVFGRGRALEVLPANQLDAQLIQDVTKFLCGACSCQVKESNPGFDLLLNADWDVELFGEGGLSPPPAKTLVEPGQAPQLLTIPSGRKK